MTSEKLMSTPAALASVKLSEKPQVSVASAETWHRRLGHLYPRRVETLATMVDRLEIKEGTLTDQRQICETCQITELKRQISRRPATRDRIFGRYGRIHFDMIQLNRAQNGDKWVTHLYIEGIRFHIIHTHKEKSGCVEAITTLIGFCRSQLGIRIRAFMTDGERSLGHVIRT